MLVLRLAAACLATVATPAPAASRDQSPYSCPFRQLAHGYADKVLGGRGLGRVAAGLNLTVLGSTSSNPGPGGCAAPHAAAHKARGERPVAGLDFPRWSTSKVKFTGLTQTLGQL
jgi:hypothetical protein